MKKSDVLAILDRRMEEVHKVMVDPDTPSVRKSRAGGAWHALLSVKIEIEDKGTIREGRDYLPCI